MNDSIVSRLVALDADAWHAYCVLSLMLAQAGETSISRDELSIQLGVSVQTIRKRLRVLEAAKLVKIDSVGRIAADVAAVDLATNVSVVFLRTLDDSVKNENTTATNVTSQDVISRWSARYKAKYGVAYSYGSQFYVAKNAAAKFVRTYGNDALAIVDLVIENYDAVWRQPTFPRPTFGQLTTWLGGEAAAMQSKNRRCDKTTINERDDNFEEMI